MHCFMDKEVLNLRRSPKSHSLGSRNQICNKSDKSITHEPFAYSQVDDLYSTTAGTTVTRKQLQESNTFPAEESENTADHSGKVINK